MQRSSTISFSQHFSALIMIHSLNYLTCFKFKMKAYHVGLSDGGAAALVFILFAILKIEGKGEEY